VAKYEVVLFVMVLRIPAPLAVYEIVCAFPQEGRRVVVLVGRDDDG
jgi:hypothetical protein